MVRTGSSCGASCAKAAVVALGNPYRGDDGVGPALLRALRSVTREPLPVTGNPMDHGSLITDHGLRVTEYDLLESAHGGLPLAQALVDYQRVLIVDAAPWLPPGEVKRFPLEELSATVGYFHGLGFRAALEMVAHAGGEEVPEVEILAIGIPEDPRFGEGLSPVVERALPLALKEAIEWLRKG
ncbi:hypothetical protein DRJ54_05105 [Candidatus Acetothermia bacterium]|nr:MAG: hypothetical protein DRJ54_05105 [Candidatus Acetothermia bacterium]